MGDFESVESMSHEEATDLNAAELYVLKDLTREQEVRFEAHYFECQDCARAVAVEQALAAAAPRKAKPWWPRLAWPVWAPATAALAALVAFQNLYSIPSLRAQIDGLAGPQANTVITAHLVQMGSDEGKVVNTPSATVELALPPGIVFPFYRVEILGRGTEPISKTVPAPEGSRLSLHVASRTLGYGSFDVQVYGLARGEVRDGERIGQYYFTRKGNSNASTGR